MTKLELVKEKLQKVSSRDLDSVNNFIDRIISKKKNVPKRKFRFDWKGALKEERISSVELQHKIVDEWGKLD